MISRGLIGIAVFACVLCACCSGCLTSLPYNSNNSSATTAPTGASSPPNSTRSTTSASISGNPVGDLNAYFSERAVIVVPFKLVPIEDHIAFIGTIKDKKSELPRTQHNITYVTCEDVTDASEQVHVFSTFALSDGYVETASFTSDNTTYWIGHKEELSDFVVISSCERGDCETGLGRTYVPHFDTPTVAVDYISKSY